MYDKKVTWIFSISIKQNTRRNRRALIMTIAGVRAEWMVHSARRRPDGSPLHLRLDAGQRRTHERRLLFVVQLTAGVVDAPNLHDCFTLMGSQAGTVAECVVADPGDGNLALTHRVPDVAATVLAVGRDHYGERTVGLGAVADHHREAACALGIDAVGRRAAGVDTVERQHVSAIVVAVDGFQVVGGDQVARVVVVDRDGVVDLRRVDVLADAGVCHHGVGTAGSAARRKQQRGERSDDDQQSSHDSLSGS